MAAKTQRAVDALLQEFLQRYPDEAARMLQGLPIREIVRVLQAAPVPQAVGVLERLIPEVAAQVLEGVDEPVARSFLTQLDPVRGAILLSRLDDELRVRRLASLDSQRARELQSLMTYPPDRAAYLMDPRVTAFRADSTVKEALSRLRQSRQKRIHDLFVTDPEGRLIGMVPLHDIAVSLPSERLETLIRGTPVFVDAMTTREEVVEAFGQPNVHSLPVVDVEGRLLGVIRHNALVAAAQEEVSADIQTMVGASKEERALSRISFAVRKRLPWLQINLATAFLAAAVVGIFESTIARFTALAVLLPIVAGQSGNTGAQALAVTMRGLALREVRVQQWFRIVTKEFNVSLINGLGVALTTSLGVYLWSRSEGLAAVIGISMVISMVAAGLAGAAIPMILTAMDQDPAQSSSIILTTVTDVVGFLSFLGIATMLSHLL